MSTPRLVRRYGFTLLVIGTCLVFMGAASFVSAIVLDVGDARSGLRIAGLIGIVLGFVCALSGNLMIQRARIAAPGSSDRDA